MLWAPGIDFGKLLRLFQQIVVKAHDASTVSARSAIDRNEKYGHRSGATARATGSSISRNCSTSLLCGRPHRSAYVVALVMWRSAAIILEFRLRTIGGTPHKLGSGPTDRSEALGRLHVRRWFLGDATNRKEL
jgi:hypothetical protein